MLGGFFSSFNGVPRGRLVRLNPDGSVDGNYDTGIGANNTVVAMAKQSDGKIVVAGLFSSLNAVTRNFVARLH